jgi:23S rRNA U2552 (ribose-2'-O)-methylase RlmE/FtsJ
MSFFLLPSIPLHDNIENIMNLSYNDDSNKTEEKQKNIRINKTLFSYLNEIKQCINSQISVWDKYKKFTNPYEYIHSPIPNTKQSVCKIVPLSRSFFKMIELIHLMNLFENISNSSSKCNTFHLAEGPGGFIEATSYLRNCSLDTYYAMTLINDNDQTVPGWKKSKIFLNNNKNVIIEKGIDETGNLMNPDNLKYCYEKYKSTMDFITADGGFDFSADFNNQELISGKLLFCQIAFAIAMQKKGGNFVVKCFDTFTRSSIDMVYILSMLYNQVYFVKPNTSRYTNSEKYIVCKEFRVDNVEKIVYKMIEMIENYNKIQSNVYMERCISIDIPHYFVNKVEEYNAILGQQQIENIFSTLSMINNKYNNHFEDIKNLHIQKCIGWCKKYKLPYYKASNYSNNGFYVTNQFFNKSKSINKNICHDELKENESSVADHVSEQEHLSSEEQSISSYPEIDLESYVEADVEADVEAYLH